MDGFGDRLRDRARELGLTDVDVARRAGLEVARYGNYSRDRTEPDLATLVRISQVLGTTPNALLCVEAEADLDRRRMLAAINALENDDRTLAIAILNAIVDHRKGRRRRRRGPNKATAKRGQKNAKDQASQEGRDGPAVD